MTLQGHSGRLLVGPVLELTAPAPARILAPRIRALRQQISSAPLFLGNAAIRQIHRSEGGDSAVRSALVHRIARPGGQRYIAGMLRREQRTRGAGPVFYVSVFSAADTVLLKITTDTLIAILGEDAAPAVGECCWSRVLEAALTVFQPDGRLDAQGCSLARLAAVPAEVLLEQLCGVRTIPAAQFRRKFYQFERLLNGFINPRHRPHAGLMGEIFGVPDVAMMDEWNHWTRTNSAYKKFVLMGSQVYSAQFFNGSSQHGIRHFSSLTLPGFLDLFIGLEVTPLPRAWSSIRRWLTADSSAAACQFPGRCHLQPSEGHSERAASNGT